MGHQPRRSRACEVRACRGAGLGRNAFACLCRWPSRVYPADRWPARQIQTFREFGVRSGSVSSGGIGTGRARAECASCGLQESVAKMTSPRARRRGRPPTIIDVAREAKVGVMSVSRMINNHPSVKHSTRTKVMKAIARIGYSPNDAARMLKGRRGRTIGLVVPDLSDFFSSCFHAVQEVSIRHDYQTLVVATGRSVAVEDQQLESIQNHRVAGLLIVTSGSDGRRLKIIQESGIPVVALDRPVAGLQTDAVLVENREGAEQGVRHLIEHGHKKIACVGFDSGSYTVRERIEGYKLAMRNAGLEPILSPR